MKELIISCLLASGLIMNATAQERKPEKTMLMINSLSHQPDAKVTVYREWPTRKLMDTANLQNGNLTLTITDELPAVYSVQMRKPYAGATIFLDKQGARIVFGKDLAVTVNSNKHQQSLRELETGLAPIEKEWQQVGQQYVEEKDMEKKILLEKKSAEFAHEVGRRKLDFVKKNSGNITGAWLAYNNAFAWGSEDLNVLVPLFKNQAWAQKTFEKLLEKLAEKNATLMIGKNAPMFTLTSIKGNSVALDSILRNNEYVLVDFWASWCTPCRSTNRKLAPLYAELKKKGIEFVSISVDEDKTAWEKAVVADKIPWMQLLSTGGMKGECVKEYKVQVLPSTFLINKQGVIVQQHLEIADLQKLAASIK